MHAVLKSGKKRARISGRHKKRGRCTLLVREGGCRGWKQRGRRGRRKRKVWWWNGKSESRQYQRIYRQVLDKGRAQQEKEDHMEVWWRGAGLGPHSSVCAWCT